MIHHGVAGRRRARLTAFATLALTALAACGQDSAVAPAKPVLPDQPAIPAQYRGAAFIMDVSTLRKSVKITAPNQTIRSAQGAVVGNDAAAGRINTGLAGLGGGTIAQSLLGGDVIDLVATNYVAGALGANTPNKILITFDLQVNNKLNGVDLILATFPTPPPSAAGPLMFPFEISVTTTSGGVSVGGAGNEVIVSSPRGGAVATSTDWDGNGTPGSGAPWNFFDTSACTLTSPTCFRYEEYGNIPALGSSLAKKVGFLIDPTVGDFRVKMIVAADLRNASGPAQFGTVAGTVTSPQIGNISGASVSVSGGYSGTTSATGAYSITSVGIGSRTVSIANLPSGCVAPAAQSVTVTNGGTATANFSVTCSVPTGSVNGTITSSLGGGIAGATVTLTPTGGSAMAPFTTGAAGTYVFSNVPVGAGTGSIALANLPANCTTPAPASYSGLTNGGTVTLNITVTCTTPPQTGTVAGTVISNQGSTPISGASVVVTPTGDVAQPAVTTSATGQYSRNNVPVGAGTGQVVVSGLPTGCTASPASYSGLTNGGTVTVNITASCPVPPFSYNFTGTWGAITATGPTGRQVTLTLAIDMGNAPGLPDVNGSARDELVGVQFTLQYNGTLLTYASKLGLDPNLDLSVVASPSAGITNGAVTSSSAATSNGNVQLVRVTYNIPAGAAGTVNVTTSFTEVLAGLPASPLDKKGNTVASVPALVIP